MNLEQLRTAGAFVDNEPVKVPVSWKGNDFDVYIRRLAYGHVELMQGAEGNPGVAMIAAAVLLGEDREPIPREDAQRLDVGLAAKLMDAINEVNAPKN